MRKASCQGCNTEGPSAEMLVVNGRPICRPCAETKAQEAQAAGHKLEFARIIDPTICGLCSTDFGSGELPFIGGTPVCANCSTRLYDRPYPSWLKLTTAGLLLLLAGSLWRGVPYFKAGRHLVLAERAMDRNEYKTASLHFAEVLKISPTDQRVVLLGAKANLMVGDVASADKFLNLRKEYERNDLFNEVNSTWDRAIDAYKKAESAGKLAEQNKDAEAAQLMHEASAEYPQSAGLIYGALSADAAVAFDQKDYDGFLRIRQSLLEQEPENPDAFAGVASALACKYAVSGDVKYKQQSEEMLEKARVLSQNSPQLKAGYEEYSERIRYRLESKVIVDKKEYDRRFRKQEAKK